MGSAYLCEGPTPLLFLVSIHPTLFFEMSDISDSKIMDLELSDHSLI